MSDTSDASSYDGTYDTGYGYDASTYETSYDTSTPAAMDAGEAYTPDSQEHWDASMAADSQAWAWASTSPHA